jgi:hypothetical protein
MKTRFRFTHSLIAAALVVVSPLMVARGLAQVPSTGPLQPVKMADGRIAAGGQVFDSYDAYLLSDLFLANVRRCGMADVIVEAGGERLLAQVKAAAGGSTADCSLSLTNPSAIYDPSVVKFYIPVVVHVIQHTDGSGFLDLPMIQSQIDVLNEDFLALPMTLGEDGTDVQLEFFLATVDPMGVPTSGVTYSINNLWFNDSGTYWTSLAWDTNRYLNIYTNLASGNLGYVPDLPQGGSIVGTSADRVVCLYTAFGRNSPEPFYDLGRTATHEVGHYLGLYHVFQGCDSGSCNSSGDRCCDTPPSNDPNFNCDNGFTCGMTDANTNYMDYTDDNCMDRFTPEQGKRMRCTLEHWRPQLGQLEPFCTEPPPIDCNNNCALDSDEIAEGLVQDCNGNGVPDGCDLATSSPDCNENAVPDECEDCNGNGLADECEFSGVYTADSGALGPIGTGVNIVHTFIGPPEATNLVTIDILAVADIGSLNENLTVSMNNTLLSTIFNSLPLIDCSDPPALEAIVLPAAYFNNLVATGGGNAMFLVEASSTVSPSSCSGNSSVTISLSYEGQVASNDTNGNGVPDECDRGRGDNNLDGVVDVTDLLNLLAAWGPCMTPGPVDCPEDTDEDGDVDVADLLKLLAGWG